MTLKPIQKWQSHKESLQKNLSNLIISLQNVDSNTYTHTLSGLKTFEAFNNMSPNPKPMLGFLLAMSFLHLCTPQKKP
jgi:hypothetical protein